MWVKLRDPKHTWINRTLGVNHTGPKAIQVPDGDNQIIRAALSGNLIRKCTDDEISLAEKEAAEIAKAKPAAPTTPAAAPAQAESAPGDNSKKGGTAVMETGKGNPGGASEEKN